MGEEVDIISLNDKILESFQLERDKLPLYIKQLQVIKETLKCPDLLFSSIRNLEKAIQTLRNKIDDIKRDRTSGFYEMETAELIQHFRDILRRPKRVSFMGAVVEDNSEKDALVDKYSVIVKNLCPKFAIARKPDVPDPNPVCENCKEQKFEIDGFSLCTMCGEEKSIPASSSSYKDAERVNVGSKYTYDKRIHFRDCLNQFQGKQNSSIPPKIYQELETEFHNHGLLIQSRDKKEKFKNITKAHVLLFLKETGNSKYYEDAVLIHFNITGIKPPDIGSLESKVLSDFDKLVETYELLFRGENKEIARKNFINNSYVLYQLLRRHKFQCDISQFNILKTVERKSFHDDVCRKLFKALGWNFRSCF